jgi:protein TonB
LGLICLFSAGSSVHEDRVYSVSLAEFPLPDKKEPSPSSVRSAPAEEAAPFARPAPRGETPNAARPKSGPRPLEQARLKAPVPEPARRAAPEAEAGLSPEIAPERSVFARTPSADSQAQAPSLPPSGQYGGLAAYAQEQLDQRPAISRRVDPEYPDRARQIRLQGKVVVEMVVDSAGLPRACVIHSAEPPGYFEQAALEAAGKFRFSPGRIRGVPVSTLIRLPFVFRLR